MGESFPENNISFYGCAGHIGNLLLKDIGKLDSISSIVDSCFKIVNEIRRSRILIAVFTEIQESNIDDPKKITLKVSGKTRWGSNVRCLKSVLENKSNLQALAISKKVADVLDAKTKEVLLDDIIRWKIEQVVDLLLPILDWITIWECDNIRSSLVIQGFHEIGVRMRNFFNKASSILNCLEAREIDSLLVQWRTMALKPIHYAAHLLDPNFRSNILEQDEIDTVHIYISKIANKFTNSSKEDIILEVSDYYGQNDFYELDHVKTSIMVLHATRWWETCILHPERILLRLQQLLKGVFRLRGLCTALRETNYAVAVP